MTDDFRVIFTPSDYDRSIRFYGETLGLPVVASWNDPDDRGTIFRAGPGTIELVARPSIGLPSGFRLAIAVGDPDALRAEFRRRDVPVVDEPATRPWGYREFRVADPDGVILAFYSVVDPAAAGHD